MPQFARRPITLLLAAALIAALFTFRDFGLTWDEPLFYQYGDALGYAYSPANWVSGHFELSQSYGPSGDDHKTRGAGYLVIARLPARLLQDLGLDLPSSWHLVNFGAFLLGIYFVYRLSRWVAGEAAAVLGAALFAAQPLLWGHAFINPKDIPFLTLFAGAVWVGVDMVDRTTAKDDAHRSPRVADVLVPAVILGLATSTRVLGPLAGLLVSAYWLARQPSVRTLALLAAYAIIAAVVTFATWPYLWESPLRFVEVFGLMARNPTVLHVLFADTVYRAPDLPLRYLPFYLATTLTEPVWPLFGLGSLAVIFFGKGNPGRWLRFSIVLAWVLIPLGYGLALRPPLYDGLRHFLFVLPPVIIVSAAGIDWLFTRLAAIWSRLTLAALILFPGALGIILLHPYEYAYFNALVGGTGGAFRHYETEYWLTCYKESVEQLNRIVAEPARLIVHREANVAAPYAAPGLTVLEERTSRGEIRSGDYILVNTRTNEDLHTFRDAPSILSVAREGATFCVIKRVP